MIDAVCMLPGPSGVWLEVGCAPRSPRGLPASYPPTHPTYLTCTCVCVLACLASVCACEHAPKDLPPTIVLSFTLGPAQCRAQQGKGGELIRRGVVGLYPSLLLLLLLYLRYAACLQPLYLPYSPPTHTVSTTDPP